jgi:hypothetical protein
MREGLLDGEQTDFTKRLDITTISGARGAKSFHVVSWRSVMRGSLFMLAILMVAPVLAQSPNPKTHQTITGCLTSTGSSHEYQLVDEKGVTSIVYSTTVHLNSYVGKSVSLVGDQSATPSTDTGTGRPMPHFKVVKVQPASGDCKK